MSRENLKLSQKTILISAMKKEAKGKEGSGAGAWQGKTGRHGEYQAEAGRNRRGMDFHCIVKENEIFLIFRSKNSNLVTWMSPKARNEPGWRIAGGCVRLTQLCRNI